MSKEARMKASGGIMLVTLAWIWIAPQCAHAFYNPSQGRWLNRDPIGERGGPNSHVFNDNNAVARVDMLGLCDCECLGVTVTYTPGGNEMVLDWYGDPVNNGVPRFGNTIHVVWQVSGNPTNCSYFQDETGNRMDITRPDGSHIIVPGLNNQHGQENYDDLGFNPQQEGYYLVDLLWDVVFRCISSDSTTVERRDGPWWFLVRTHYPPLK